MEEGRDFEKRFAKEIVGVLRREHDIEINSFKELKIFLGKR